MSEEIDNSLGNFIDNYFAIQRDIALGVLTNFQLLYKSAKDTHHLLDVLMLEGKINPEIGVLIQKCQGRPFGKSNLDGLNFRDLTGTNILPTSSFDVS